MATSETGSGSAAVDVQDGIASPSAAVDLQGGIASPSAAVEVKDAFGAPSAADEKDEAGSPPASASDPADPSASHDGAPDVSLETWPARVADLAKKRKEGTVGTDRADALFRALGSDLLSRQAGLYDALGNRSIDALERRAKLAEIYSARVRMLDLISPGLRERVTSLGVDGWREIRIEVDHAKLDFLFQALAIPHGMRQIGEDLRASPVSAMATLAKLLFGIVVFGAWRRWAKTGLREARRKVLALRPSTNLHHHLARFLWYLDRFRPPLEWLALLFFVSTLREPGDLEEITSLVSIILVWTLLTWLGLLVVDAIASRGGEGPSRRVPGLRRRSLRLVAAWFLLSGVGLDLTSRYVGQGVIYTWAVRAYVGLLIPIALILLVWWREGILHRVRQDAEFSATARRIGKQQKGVRGYVNAIVGASYILGAELLQFAIRVFSRFEGGRKLMATLLRRETERDAQGSHVAEKAISEELVFELLTADETVIESPFRDALEEVKAIVENGVGGTVAVLAERGGGMKTFLDLLQREVGKTMRIVDCAPGGPDGFDDALASAFGLSVGADFEDRLRSAVNAEGVRIVGVCNFHRVARPQMGGLVGIERAAEISEAVGADVLWIFGLTRAAWPYISRMLGDRGVVQEVVELRPWTESELEELFDARCRKAGIQPDYRKLAFPRQFDDGERESVEERNRFGLHRILWELSDGNPEVAIRLYVSCLHEHPSGGIVVRLPQTASSDRIAASNLATLLILKVLVETELATVEDLQASIREPVQTVRNCLSHCVQEGWVEQVYDHYQISWSAYRRVKRILVRRGLIAR